jgi:hypothetical protein
MLGHGVCSAVNHFTNLKLGSAYCPNHYLCDGYQNLLSITENLIGLVVQLPFSPHLI